jgi:RNA polymerase primary sigma factor
MRKKDGWTEKDDRELADSIAKRKAEAERLVAEFGPALDWLLTPRELKILKLWHGLDGGRRHSLDEIAKLESTKDVDVTRERIRQIQAKAWRKLRQIKAIVGPKR